MRLWHYAIIYCLPKSQLLAQKRECDFIWKDIKNGKKTNHILINYIWEYETYKTELLNYYYLLFVEFNNRGFKFIDKSGYNLSLRKDIRFLYTIPFHKHHTHRYLLQCFYNLQEKYDRGQKDFSEKDYKIIESRVKQWLQKDTTNFHIN